MAKTQLFFVSSKEDAYYVFANDFLYTNKQVASAKMFCKQNGLPIPSWID